MQQKCVLIILWRYTACTIVWCNINIGLWGLQMNRVNYRININIGLQGIWWSRVNYGVNHRQFLFVDSLHRNNPREICLFVSKSVCSTTHNVTNIPGLL